MPEIGIKRDRHSLSHHNGNKEALEQLTRSDEFNVRQFAYFLDRLSEVRDGGGTLIDTTLALYGSGLSSYGNSHGTTSLPLVLAGGASLGSSTENTLITTSRLKSSRVMDRVWASITARSTPKPISATCC